MVELELVVAAEDKFEYGAKSSTSWKFRTAKTLIERT